ncbi:MAG: hypothetical protein JHC98_00580 [Thermoleophilaceae bacterium]|nr:hypothetical protein [Thermoleophilaceae bacterium]
MQATIARSHTDTEGGIGTVSGLAFDQFHSRNFNLKAGKSFFTFYKR